MSIALMTTAWLIAKLSHVQLIVLLALADFANDDGLAFPAVERIVHKTNRKRRTVQRALRDLEAMGLLEVVARGGDDWGASTVYRLTFDGAELKPEYRKITGVRTDKAIKRVVHSDAPRASESTRTGVRTDKKRAHSDAQIIKEPSVTISEPPVEQRSAQLDRVYADALVCLREFNLRAHRRYMPTRETIGAITERIIEHGRDVVLKVTARKILELFASERHDELRTALVYGDARAFARYVAELTQPIVRTDGQALPEVFSAERLTEINAPWPDVRTLPTFESDEQERAFFLPQLASDQR